jgi:hypothetical protein
VIIGVPKEITSDEVQETEVGEVWHFDVWIVWPGLLGGSVGRTKLGDFVKLFLDNKDLVPAVWSSLESRGSCGLYDRQGFV